ncbi:MOSC domain-containing protein [Paenibacillus xerothermodurans]|uniref:MOSC domain-containing protein n=1 Tax=Paenibacillus xerothermodurans TaxID=1977292 RepID=A0A2W1NBB9_PAEXE|nr:MOSC domain-containing protein [Paenibacillus xerothermodurans]PZE21184.1 MOSC domain-containing protein [Paenibacillus xerothermodurans]
MQLLSINVSKPLPVNYQGRTLNTGIFKLPVAGKVWLSELNLADDGQADLIHHGGADKAVCVYSVEHYPFWEEKLQRKLVYGAFGENFTVSGLAEAEIHVGDVYAVGEAVVQVSQPRQPCFKLGYKHQAPALPEQIQSTGYTGFYFRVLKPGYATAGEIIRLVERHPGGVTIADAHRLRNTDVRDIKAIRELLSVDALSDSWRKSFERKLNAELNS